MARVQELGIDDHVVFFNQFVDQPTLLDFISMCDVYVTPYLNEAQMTSGTLAYSFGLGKAVVSTPYWHAKELLADGRGILVPFGDAKAMGSEISESADGRRPPRCHAQARLCGEPIDDMGANGKALSRSVSKPAHERSPRPNWRLRSSAVDVSIGREPPFRRWRSAISSRSATAPECSSMPSIRWRTARMATVSMTTHAPCCSQARLRIPAKRSCCPKSTPHALRHSSSTHGIRTPADSAIS